MNKRKAGAAYEQIAADYLKRQGVRIVEQNYRTTQGEVDLIGETKEFLIFIEVKYRKNADFGSPLEAVSKQKQQKISQVARQYCYSKRIQKQVRYDVVGICGEEITWIQNAFEHQGWW